MNSLKRKDFRLLMLLGLGQTAQVYLAEAPGLGKVALKLPKKEVRQDPRLSERFAREVTLALSLKHPHLVRGLAGVPLGRRPSWPWSTWKGAPWRNASTEGPCPGKRR